MDVAPDEATSVDGFALADVRDLIAEYPLAWVCAPRAQPFQASLLPLLGEYAPEGALVGLVGHLARRNPLFAALSQAPDAVILFQGPQGYVSPEHAGRRDWAPTWNYAQLCIEAEVSFRSPDTEEAVRRLVETMEAGREAPWRPEELGARYEGMAGRIIGFRAKVKSLRGRFKLGQDETTQTLGAILERLEDPALGRWMRRMNRGRA